VQRCRNLALAGLTLTERVTAGWYRADPERAASPRFAGRAVVALPTDPNIMARTGQAVSIFDLAAEFGFVDVDGRSPPDTRPKQPQS
jgi:dehydrogenase/reductase SDR family protein 1